MLDHLGPWNESPCGRTGSQTETQIVRILKEGEAGVPIADLVGKYRISPCNVCQVAAFLLLSGTTTTNSGAPLHKNYDTS